MSYSLESTNNNSLKKLAKCVKIKVIVIAVSSEAKAHSALELLNKELKLSKPHHGIAFSVPIYQVAGSSSCKCCDSINKVGDDGFMYNSITVIVDKGNAEEIIEAATKAGSKGGTIINARGSGIHETSKLFSMEIEPEKEIVLILSERESTKAIVDSIRTDLKLDEPGNGIVFIQNVNAAYGLYD